MWKWVIPSIICTDRYIFFPSSYAIQRTPKFTWRNDILTCSFETLLCFSLATSWACTLALETKLCLQCLFVSTCLNVFAYLTLKNYITFLCNHQIFLKFIFIVTICTPYSFLPLTITRLLSTDFPEEFHGIWLCIFIRMQHFVSAISKIFQWKLWLK